MHVLLHYCLVASLPLEDIVSTHTLCLPHLPKLINVVTIFWYFACLSLQSVTHVITLVLPISQSFHHHLYNDNLCTWLPVHAHSIAMHLCMYDNPRPAVGLVCSWMNIISARWHRRLGLPVTAQDSCAVTRMVPMTLLSC